MPWMFRISNFGGGELDADCPIADPEAENSSEAERSVVESWFPVQTLSFLPACLPELGGKKVPLKAEVLLDVLKKASPFFAVYFDFEGNDNQQVPYHFYTIDFAARQQICFHLNNFLGGWGKILPDSLLPRSPFKMNISAFMIQAFSVLNRLFAKYWMKEFTVLCSQNVHHFSQTFCRT